MKTLKQGPTTQSRRPARPKGGNIQRRAAATQQKSGNLPSEVAKKSRIIQAKIPSSTPIQCISCKQGDVPLLLGGSTSFQNSMRLQTVFLTKDSGYCRTCVESGKWKSDSAQPTTAVQSVQSHPQSVQPTAPAVPVVPVTQDPQ